MIWIILSLILILLYFGFSYALYQVGYYNDSAKKNDPPFGGPQYDKYSEFLKDLRDQSKNIDYEDVYVNSFDGLKLCAHLYVSDPIRPFHIAFHGYKANGKSNFCGPVKIAFDRGDNLLLVDQRACGNSEGHTISFGINERKDALVWANYIVSRFGNDSKIYLEGVSMGGATVLMSSGLNLPDNVKGIFADCPFSSPVDIIYSVIGQSVKFPDLVLPFAKSGAKIFGKFNLEETTALEAVSKSSVPIAIIHGTDDHFVPMKMSHEIYEKYPDKVTYTKIDGAPHAIAYAVDPEKYKKTFEDFLESTGA